MNIEHLLTTPESSFSSVATSRPGENRVKAPHTTVRGCRAEDVPTCRYARAAAAARRCCFLKSRPPAARHQTSLLLEAALPGSQCLSRVLDVDVSGGRLCKRDALSGVTKQKHRGPLVAAKGQCGSQQSQIKCPSNLYSPPTCWNDSLCIYWQNIQLSHERHVELVRL